MLKTYCHLWSRAQKDTEWLSFRFSHENKSKHCELSFVSLFLIGNSRFLPLFLLCSIWINVTSFWSRLFSLWLFIYLFQLHPREQKACRMATDSHVEYLFLPNLAVFSHCCHLMSLCKAESSPLWKGCGASWVSDPHRRGVLKVRKKARARDGWTRRREKIRRGGGTPAGSQASRLAVPILASDGFCQRREKRVSSSLGHGTIDVLSVREGVSVGEYGGMLKEE